MATDDEMKQARETRAKFYELLEKAVVAGAAHKEFPHPDLFAASMNAFEQLVDVEREAVRAHQQAFGRPVAGEMLRQACEEAAFPFEKPDVDPDHWEFWAQQVYREAAPPPDAHGRDFLRLACEYARKGRFFFAAEMLRQFARLAGR